MLTRPKPATSPGRGRARAVTWKDRTQTEQRIALIVDLMATNEWVRGETAPMLAKDWGVTVHRVEQLSAEASRIVRRSVGDPKEIKKILLTNLHQALEATRAKGEFRTMIEAVRTIGSFHGLVRDRLEISKPADDFDGWSEAEYEAYIAHGEWPRRLLKGGGGKGDGGGFPPASQPAG